MAMQHTKLWIECPRIWLSITDIIHILSCGGMGEILLWAQGCLVSREKEWDKSANSRSVHKLVNLKENKAANKCIVIC